MRAILLILIFGSTLWSNGQTTGVISLFDQEYCRSIVDSLDKAGYFRKAQQIDLNAVPVRAKISINSGSGCLVSVHNSFEFLYSDSTGFMVNSRTGSGDKYIKFRGPATLTELFSVLNQNYMVDSTLLIKNPDHGHSSGEGGMSIDVNIEFHGGKTFNKRLYFPWSSRAYCTYKYFENFYQYLTKLQNQSFKPVDYGIAYYLYSTFNSEISRLYVVDCDNTYPTMKTIPPFTKDIIEIIQNNDLNLSQ